MSIFFSLLLLLCSTSLYLWLFFHRSVHPNTNRMCTLVKKKYKDIRLNQPPHIIWQLYPTNSEWNELFIKFVVKSTETKCFDSVEKKFHPGFLMYLTKVACRQTCYKDEWHGGYYVIDSRIFRCSIWLLTLDVFTSFSCFALTSVAVFYFLLFSSFSRSRFLSVCFSFVCVVRCFTIRIALLAFIQLVNTRKSILVVASLFTIDCYCCCFVNSSCWLLDFLFCSFTHSLCFHAIQIINWIYLRDSMLKNDCDHLTFMPILSSYCWNGRHMIR